MTYRVFTYSAPISGGAANYGNLFPSLMVRVKFVLEWLHLVLVNSSYRGSGLGMVVVDARL